MKKFDHLLPTVYNPFIPGMLIDVPENSTYGPDDYFNHMEGWTTETMSVEVDSVFVCTIPFRDIPEPHCVVFKDENDTERHLLVTQGLVKANETMLRGEKR